MTTSHIPEHFAGVPHALNESEEAGHTFAFLLVPGFTYIGFASAIEPLRMANMAADNRVFGALTVTLDGEPVQASNGVLTTPDHSIDSLPNVRTVIVCGPNPIPRSKAPYQVASGPQGQGRGDRRNRFRQRTARASRITERIPLHHPLAGHGRHAGALPADRGVESYVRD